MVLGMENFTLGFPGGKTTTLVIHFTKCYILPLSKNIFVYWIHKFETVVKSYLLQCSVSLLVIKPFRFCCNTYLKNITPINGGPGVQSFTLELKFRSLLPGGPGVGSLGMASLIVSDFKKQVSRCVADLSIKSWHWYFTKSCSEAFEVWWGLIITWFSSETLALHKSLTYFIANFMLSVGERMLKMVSIWWSITTVWTTLDCLWFYVFGPPYSFLPARRYASAVFATATCLSVRPSVTRRYCA